MKSGLPASSVYLDANGAVPLRPEAKIALEKGVLEWGNPSSIHASGRRARGFLEEARHRIASAVGASTQEIIFTSGGTEANALALKGIDLPDLKVFVSSTDHDSVRKQRDFPTLLPVDHGGQVDFNVLEEMLQKISPPFLCSVIWGHNETGVLNDVKKLARLVQERGGIFHTDAVQVLGKKTIEFQKHYDLMTLSSLKVGGPSGIGALVVRTSVPLGYIMAGGGQERGMRSGTLNVALAMAFAAAVEAAEEKKTLEQERCRLWQKRIETRLQEVCPGCFVVGQEKERLANTSFISMPGVKTEVQLMAFDLVGIAVSAGSACSSGKIGPSASLKAMGVPEEVSDTTIRVTTSWQNTDEDIDFFIKNWEIIYGRMRPKQGVLNYGGI